MVLTEKSTPMVEMNCKVGTSGGAEGGCQGMREACGGTVAVAGDHGGHCDHGGGLRSPARTLPSYSSSVYRFTILDFPTAESPMSSTCVEHWGRHRAGNVQSDEEGRAVGAGGQGERGGRSASTGGLEAGVMRRMGEGGGFKVTTAAQVAERSDAPFPARPVRRSTGERWCSRHVGDATVASAGSRG